MLLQSNVLVGRLAELGAFVQLQLSSAMTRAELADFIRRFADGTSEHDEWEYYITQHYTDIETEVARTRIMRLMHRKGGNSPIGIEADIRMVADMLMGPVLTGTFYFKDGAAGILRETLPLADDGIISYEPYRSGSHLDMHEALRSGIKPRCEYMHDGRRNSFTVVDAPEYGRLSISV